VTEIAAKSTVSDERAATLELHGQLIFGTERVYLFHLPMFMYDVRYHPHNYQVIMEVDLTDDETDPKAMYIADRKAHPEIRVYTLSPEKFAMVDLISNTNQSIRSFKGDIYRGHFEREGTKIIQGVTINVKNIIYLHKFNPETENLKNLEYLLFGQGKEIFMAHIITKPPDFDQVLEVDRVLAVEAVNPVLSDEELSDRGIRVFFPGKENNLAMKLREEETVQGERFRRDPSEAKLEINIGKEIYFEEDELSEFCDPCQGANTTWHKH
jgi:hypothetical protein